MKNSKVSQYTANNIKNVSIKNDSISVAISKPSVKAKKANKMTIRVNDTTLKLGGRAINTLKRALELAHQ